jgi:hypothetical protein
VNTTKAKDNPASKSTLQLGSKATPKTPYGTKPFQHGQTLNPKIRFTPTINTETTTPNAHRPRIPLSHHNPPQPRPCLRLESQVDFSNLIQDPNLARRSKLKLEYRAVAPFRVWHSLHSKQQNHESGKVLHEVDPRALNRVLPIKISQVNLVVWYERSITRDICSISLTYSPLHK